jgi:hypothetical protein
MNNSEVVDGKHRKSEKQQMEDKKETLGPEAVTLMKSQDRKYLQTVIARDRNKEEKLRASLHFARGDKVYGGLEGIETKNKRTIFVEGGVAEGRKVLRGVGGKKRTKGEDDDDEDDEADDSNDDDDSEEEKGDEDNKNDGDDDEDDDYDLDIKTLLQKVAPPKSKKVVKRLKKSAKKLEKRTEKARLQSYQELDLRARRRKKLETALAFLETEKNMQSKGMKRKVDDGGGGGPPVYKWRRKRAS